MASSEFARIYKRDTGVSLRMKQSGVPMSAAVVTKFTEVLYLLVPAAIMLLGIVLASKLKAKKLAAVPIPGRRPNP